MKTQSTATRPKRKGISYAKWGYLFILPFFITYCIFALVPQLLTIYNSFFENYREGLKQVGPNFVGMRNCSCGWKARCPRCSSRCCSA